MQIPRIPTLNPAPERRTDVSTPDSGSFRTTFDQIRRSSASGRERGNDAGEAQESSPPVTRSRDADRCRSEEPGSVESQVRKEPRADDRNDAAEVSTTDDRDEPTVIASEAGDVTPVDEKTASESEPEATTDGVVAEMPVAIVSDLGAEMTGAGASSPVGASETGTVRPTVTESRDSAGGTATTTMADAFSSSARAVEPGTVQAADEPAPTASNTEFAQPSESVDAAENTRPSGASTIAVGAESVTSNDAASVGASTRTAAALPEGFTPVAAPTTSTTAVGTASPETTPAATSTAAAAATTASVASARPSSTDDARRTDAKAPAAVARADEVNRTIAAGRAGESAPPSETLAAEAVTAVRGADLSNRLSRPTAQALPMPGADSAPQTLDEGATRTMPGVGRGLDALARQKGGSLVMRLDPPSLGQLRLQMQMQGGRVTVLMTAASETARSLLHDNLGSLRQALEDRGLAVDRLAVETAGRTSESSSNARSENRGDGQDARGGQNASDRQDAGDGRSRGRRDDASRRHAGRGDGSGRPEAVEFGEVLAGAGVSAT
jgi:flagellar hook-length control protein FliK